MEVGLTSEDGWTEGRRGQEPSVLAPGVQEALNRILADPLFARAQKLADFLGYLVHRQAEGADRTTEYEIGVEVFKRRSGYDPGEDNIVRSYARMLRKRLDEYYDTNGAKEHLRFEMPKGGYSIQVLELSAPLDDLESDALRPGETATALESKRSPQLERPLKRAFVVGLSIVLIGLGFAIGRSGAHLEERGVRFGSASVDRLWDVLIGDRPTQIVTSDTGLTVDLGLLKRSVSPSEYYAGDYLKELHNQFPALERWDRTLAHRYNSFADSRIVWNLLHIPSVGGSAVSLTYARDLRPEDLPAGNLILLGGSNANPWVQLFDRNLNFALAFQPEKRSFRILNRHPLQGEPAEYFAQESAQDVSYGLLAILPNDRGRYVILLEGTTDSGMLASAAAATDPNLARTLSQAVRQRKTVELLIKASALGGRSIGYSVLGQRVY